MRNEYSRRSLLRMGGAALALGFAGCSSESDGSGSETTELTDLTETTEQAETTAVTTSVTTTETCEFEAIDPDEPSGTVELVHGLGYQDELMNSTKTQFESITDSQLELRHIPAGCYAKLESDMGRENAPHLVESVHDKATLYHEDGFLSDQSGNLGPLDCVLPEKGLQLGQFRGKRIGIPRSARTVALCYNEEMVDTPPETLAEMKSIMDEHHEDGGETFGLGCPVTPFYLSGFAQAYGMDIFDDDTAELGIDTDAVEKGLSVVMDDLKPYMPSDPGSGTQKSVFNDGNAPFVVDGPWQLSNFEDTDFDVGVTTLPDLPDGGVPRPYTEYKLIYFTTEMDEEPDSAGAARNFARWFATDEELLLEHAEQEDIVPVHSELRTNGRLPEKIQGFASQLETAYPTPEDDKMAAVWRGVGDAVESTFRGNGELRDNLDSAAEEIREEWRSQALSRSAPTNRLLRRRPSESIEAICTSI